MSRECHAPPQIRQGRAGALYLRAVRLTPGTPFTEVFAVVGQKSIAVFAQARARPANDLRRGIGAG